MLILFQPACFFSSGSDHFNIRKITSQFSQWCLFHPSQVVFVFPPTDPSSSRTQISYSSILLLMGSLSILFPSIFLSGDSHEDPKGTSSSSLFILFLLWWNQVKLCGSYPFSSFQIPFLAGAPHIHPLLAIQLFRSAEDVSKIRVSTLNPFKLFGDYYLIQVI